MSKLVELLGMVLNKQKKKEEEILDSQKFLEKELIELKDQLLEMRLEIETLKKGFNALSYIVGSHNVILSEVGGLTETKAVSSTKEAGALTKLPDIFSKKDNKSN